jgi:hypothetical protein
MLSFLLVPIYKTFFSLSLMTIQIVPDKPLQHSLIFTVRPGAFYSGEHLRCAQLGQSLVLQLLDYDGNVCQGQTL